MAMEFNKILLNAQNGIYVPKWRVGAEDFSGHKHDGQKWSIQKSVLVGGRQHGVDVLRVDNGCFAFDIRAVTALQRRIRAIQGGRKPQVLLAPGKDYA